MKPQQVLVLGGLGYAVWWLWGKYGESATGMLDTLTHPSTPGTTPVQTNSTPTTAPGVTPVQTNSTPDAPAPNPTPTQPPPPTSSLPPFPDYINSLHLVGANQTPLLSADEWNHYYSNWSGVPQTTDLFPEWDRGAQMTVGIYLSRRQAAGLAGMGLGAFNAAGNYLRRGNA